MSNRSHRVRRPLVHVNHTQSPPDVVEVIQTRPFKSCAAKMLSRLELRALIFALAENPLSGERHDSFEPLLVLKYANHRITYSVSPDIKRVFLLTIEKDGPGGSDDDDGSGGGPRDPEGRKELRQALGYLVKGGVFAGGKALGEWVLDFLFRITTRSLAIGRSRSCGR